MVFYAFAVASFFFLRWATYWKQFMNNLHLPCEFLGRSFSEKAEDGEETSSVELTAALIPAKTIKPN